MCEESNCKGDEECLCPIRGIVDVVSKKWTICILTLLKKSRPLRYNQIKNKIDGISPKTLSDTLKALEQEGLIKRKIYAEIPPRVEYSLTNTGKELRVALMPLVRWVRERPII